MGIRAARLYRKNTGVYFIRVLLCPSHSGFTPDPIKPANKTESKRSLRTKNHKLARKLSSYLNALLDGVPRGKRESIVDNFFEHTISTWTAGGVTCDGEDDQNRFEGFLKRFPRIEEAVATRIAGVAAPQSDSAEEPPRPHSPAPSPAPSPAWSAISDAELERLLARAQRNREAAITAAAPKSQAAPPRVVVDPYPEMNVHIVPAPVARKPMKFSDSLVEYEARMLRGAENTPRTVRDKCTLLKNLRRHLGEHYQELGSDPWLHQVESYHVSNFISFEERRPGRRKDANGVALGAAPLTIHKKMMDLGHFFETMRTEDKAVVESPMLGLARMKKHFRKLGTEEDVHYYPFTKTQIARIFDPVPYLSLNRDPDYFWGPLLGLFLGARLGDFVSTELSSIGIDPATNIPTISVRPEEAKNPNSVRTLPLTQPLIELGFLRYVERLRGLGAIYLFPHRDLTTPTAQKDPTKNQSAHFGEYMTKIGLPDPYLVFHSFRHTVIGAMHDHKVPLAVSMQIAGHEAQQHAVRTGAITQDQADSAHHIYTGASAERMGSEPPIARYKLALESSIEPGLDIVRLARAAQIVLDHTKKVGNEFRCGWAPQKAQYTARQVAKLSINEK